MSESFQVLVVCVGNVCRSPLAARLLADRLAASPRPFQVTSAGTRGLVGAPMEPAAAAELRRLGGDPEGFVASRLRAAEVHDADLVLTATRRLRSQVLELAPAALRRTFTLRELALLLSRDEVTGADPAALVASASTWRGSVAGVDPDDLDLPDPIDRPADVHRAVADLIDAATRSVADRLLGAGD